MVLSRAYLTNCWLELDIDMELCPVIVRRGELGVFSTASRVAHAIKSEQAIATRTLMSTDRGMTETRPCIWTWWGCGAIGDSVSTPRNFKTLERIFLPASVVRSSKRRTFLKFSKCNIVWIQLFAVLQSTRKCPIQQIPANVCAWVGARGEQNADA